MEMTFEESEKLRAKRIAGMSTSEIESALLRLPVTPSNDEDLLERAALTWRRLEIENAARVALQNQKPQRTDLVEVTVPPGCATCLQSLDGSCYFYAEESESGQIVIKMPWAEFRALAMSIPNGGGYSGGVWADLNPHLIDRFPKNPLPALAGPPQ